MKGCYSGEILGRREKDRNSGDLFHGPCAFATGKHFVTVLICPGRIDQPFTRKIRYPGKYLFVQTAGIMNVAGGYSWIKEGCTIIIKMRLVLVSFNKTDDPVFERTLNHSIIILYVRYNRIKTGAGNISIEINDVDNEIFRCAGDFFRVSITVFVFARPAASQVHMSVKLLLRKYNNEPGTGKRIKLYA